MKPLRLLVLSCVLFVAAASVAWLAVDDRMSGVLSLTTEDVHRFVAAWGAWAALGSIVLMVLHSVLPLPGEVIAVANGMMFGPVQGTLIT